MLGLNRLFRQIGTTENFKQFKPEQTHDPVPYTNYYVSGVKKRKAEELPQKWKIQHECQENKCPANHPSELRNWIVLRLMRSLKRSLAIDPKLARIKNL
jgi:hypothetical protein